MALTLAPYTEDQFVPSGFYVLTKRFTAKEERRRIVAAVFDPARVDAPRVGFENHINYFHQNGKGLPENLAKGLAAFLNSSLVDEFFRQFNGHTQVNATDLRNMRYPSRTQLEALGARVGELFPEQDELDAQIDKEVVNMPGDSDESNPVQAKKRIDEALAVLRDLGLPRAQLNERSALTLLALLDLVPSVERGIKSIARCPPDDGLDGTALWEKVRGEHQGDNQATDIAPVSGCWPNPAQP